MDTQKAYNNLSHEFSPEGTQRFLQVIKYLARELTFKMAVTEYPENAATFVAATEGWTDEQFQAELPVFFEYAGLLETEEEMQNALIKAIAGVMASRKHKRQTGALQLGVTQ